MIIKRDASGLQLEVLGKQENDIDYSCRDGSAEMQNRLRDKELHLLCARYPQKKILIMQQEHGDTILEIDEPSFQRRLAGQSSNGLVLGPADALICQGETFLITVVTADCWPIFLFDSSSKVMAGVHAGWRGSQKDILGQTIDRMHEKWHCRIESLQLFLLPGISAQHYQVGQEPANLFTHGVIRREGKYYLDLAAVNSEIAKKRGITKIQSANHCTFIHNDLLFSHRRKDLGRNLNIMFLHS